jgi:hypothetical protein
MKIIYHDDFGALVLAQERRSGVSMNVFSMQVRRGVEWQEGSSERKIDG